MGLLFNIVYCYYKNDLYVKEMIFIVFDLYLKGINCIYLNDLKQNIIDFVVGGIVFSFGYKIYNGVIGVDSNKQKVKMVFECVKEKGKLIGFVLIVELIDVILVVYVVYVIFRDDKNEIVK